MRARLLEVTAAQGQEAGVAAGSEDAGQGALLEMIERERSEADEHLRLVRERMDELGHRTPAPCVGDVRRRTRERAL